MKRLLTGVALIAAVTALYLLRVDDTAGLYKDDAYYMVLAQSLARGQGYALISSATTPILPTFPPGFALLLAPVFAAVPSFPANLIWLKVLSIAAMIGTGLLTFRYLHGYRDIGPGRAAGIALLTTVTPGFVFLATSTVMSECAFTFALMASAVAVERAARTEAAPHSRRATVVAALITTAAWLIRGSGIALVAGALLFLLFRRGWRTAALFLLVCGISYAPWSAYAAMHRPTEAERAAHGGDIVYSYGSPLKSPGGRGAAPRDIGAVELSRRVATNIVNIGRDIGAVIFPAGYRGAEESGLEVFRLAGATGLRAGSMGLGPAFVAGSAGLSLVVLFGAFAMARRQLGVAEFFCVFTILMLVLVPSHTYRYVLPIAPFVIGYFLIGVESIAARLRAGTGPPAFRIAAGCLLFFLGLEHAQYIWLKQQGLVPWIEDGQEVRLVTDYVDAHLPANATVVSTNPGLVYLLTGRKGVVYVDPVRNWQRWQATGLRYAVALQEVPVPSPSAGYRTRFESPRLKFWVMEQPSDAGRDRN